jgi:hypothetical protein
MKDISFEIKIPKIKLSDRLKGNLKAIFSILIVAGAFVAKQNFEFTFFDTLVLIYFGISILWKLESRISAVLALLFLVSCPILLIIKNDALAELFAIYAYYFLVITVAGEIMALKNEKNRPVDNLPRQAKEKIV